jgi:hypothetical protein
MSETPSGTVLCPTPLVLIGAHKRVYEPDFNTMTEGKWVEP